MSTARRDRPMARADHTNVSGNCPNCDNMLHGRFCSTCGQDQRIAPLTFVGMLREAFEELTDVDGRFIKTVVTLLIRPGRITTDYLHRRRAGYLPPLRMYLVTSVVLYFVLGTLTAQLTFQIDLIDSSSVGAFEDRSVADRGLVEELDARLDDMSSSPDFGTRVIAHLPEVGFILLPFVGLILKMLFLGRRHPFGEHLLAAVHIKTGVFLIVIIVAIGIGLASALGVTAASTAVSGNWPARVVLLISSLYVGACLFEIYGGNVFLSIIKTLLLLVSYWILASIGLMGVAVILALMPTT